MVVHWHPVKGDSPHPLWQVSGVWVLSTSEQRLPQATGRQTTTTTADISNILGITGKTCILDPLPTKQLSDNVESIVSIITYVTNASVENAVMPARRHHYIALGLCFYHYADDLQLHCNCVLTATALV